MRFVHTADWQIGMKASHAGSASERVREERLLAAERVVETARRSGAGFILVAGDTFEDNGVDRVLVQKVADILSGFAGPVFVIPGNHDPEVPGSVWRHGAWSSAANVRVLVAEEPLAVPGGVLFPCPLREKRSGRDPTSWIDARQVDGIRIGVAHGSVEGLDLDEPDHPVPRGAASLRGLDYLALGHWHSLKIYEDPDGACRMAYSGTHETTRFGEKDSGNVLVVDIASPGSPPALRVEVTGGLAWKRIESLDLRQDEGIASLIGEIESAESPGSTLLDLRLGGLFTLRGRAELDRLVGIARARFLFSRVDETRLRPAPGDGTWIHELPAGVVRMAASRLVELSDPSHTGPRPDGATPEAASRALSELFALAREAGR